MLGWEDLLTDREAKKALDVALHVGSLAGVIVAVTRLRPSMRMLLTAIAGSAPSALVGGLGKSVVVGRLGRAEHVAVTGAVAGSMMWWAERRATRLGAARRMDDLTMRDVAVLGISQAVALIPGVSRSGATYTAGRLRGLAADDAASYSLLLALPVVAGAGLLAVHGGEMFGPDPPVRGATAMGAITAAVTGSLVALGASRLTARRVRWLAVYRVGLGGLVLVIARRRRRTDA